MYIKRNHATRPKEGSATTFVRANTSIPVPFVVDNVTVDGQTVLVLERMPGCSIWTRHIDTTKPRITAEDVIKISGQLSALLS